MNKVAITLNERKRCKSIHHAIALHLFCLKKTALNKAERNA